MKKIGITLIVFFIASTSAFSQTIVSAEYFFDTDPGPGNGTAITVAPDSAVSLNNIPVNITSLSLGYHWIYLRTKDSDGNWSFYQGQRFYVYDNSPFTPRNDSVKLVQAEYWVDSIAQTNSPVLIGIVPNDTISIDSVAVNTLAIPVGFHDLIVRVKDNRGFWSFPTKVNFGVCSQSSAVAGFDAYVSGLDVILHNTSQNYSSNHWTFSDGYLSDQAELVRHFDTAGVYNVQLVCSEPCSADTVSKAVVIKGINSVFPDKGGNIGFITITITGAWFNTSTKVILKRTGYSDITAVDSSTYISNGVRAQAIFDLKGAALGLWDVVVDVPGDTVFTLQNKFEITNGEFPGPTVKLIGPSRLHINDWHNYSIVVTNNGNVDAMGVPVWFAIPPDVNVRLDFPFGKPANPSLDWDNIEPYIRMDTLFGEISPYHVYAFVIPSITGSSSQILNLKLRIPTVKTFNIHYWTGRPFLLHDSLQLNIRALTENCFYDPDKLECLTGLLNDVLGEILGPPNPTNIVIECLLNHLIALLHIANDYSCYWNSPQKEIESLIERLGEAGIECINDATSSPLAKYTKTISILKKIYDFYSGVGTVSACGNGFGPDNEIGEDITTLSSFDPNEKYGISGAKNSPYFNSTLPLVYEVHFENSDTASAPAQKIVVTDTLDTANLDLRTLQLMQIFVGDSTIFIPAGKKSFSTDIDLRPAIPVIARTGAYLDTLTGEIAFRLQSLDPGTLEPLTDPLVGLLPPNDSSGRGRGGIVFSVLAKKGALNGTAINNKADIYFDYNMPVSTLLWRNIIDNSKPQSVIYTLPQYTYSDSVLVNWSGSDNGPAGVYSYNIYFNVNGGSWKLWKYSTSLTSDFFLGKLDSTYGFYSRAIDSALNIEDPPLIADASTTIKAATGLPLHLLSFNINCNGNNRILKWKTASDLLGEVYQIEASTNGTDWTTVTGITVIKEGENTYSFTDNSNQGSFYRIKKTAITGKSDYSAVLRINCNVTATTIKVYPNPAKNQFNILIETGKSGKMKFKLYDSYGRVIRTMDQILQRGMNSYLFDVSDLPAGNYLLKSESFDSINTKKILINH